jgi:cardiolipin synthase A/B
MTGIRRRRDDSTASILILRMERANARAGLAVCAVLALGACSRLPDVSALVAAASTHGGMPVLVDARGPVPDERRHAVLEKLLSEGPAPGMLARQLPVAAAISPAPLVLGNRVALLSDGHAIERAIREAVSGARDHIDIETYILADDDVGRRFADLLIRKRAEHVALNLIYDGLASRGTSNAYFERLRRAGVHVLEFNPVDPFGTRVKWSPNARDHRKVFIVDGSVAILGGANVELPREVEGETWRDTDIRVEGPAVAQFQALFMQTWNEQGGDPLVDADYFPPLQELGGDVVRVVGSTATNPIYSMLIAAIGGSLHDVELTTSYFAPDAGLLATIEAAAHRGVHVKLMLPSRSNFPPAYYAGRFHYQELLDAGVEIYEREHAWLHAKTVVVDGVWSTVGTTNLDRRSFLFNREVNAVVLGAGFAARMGALFEQDVSHAHRIVPGEWQRRSILERWLEWLADVFSYCW